MQRLLGIVMAVLVASILLCSSTVWAQDIVSGQIAGVVRDTSGAVLPGVTVEAASPALIERVRSTVTDGTGQYRIVGLRPGMYTLTATLTGFNTFKRENLEISGSGVVSINVDLKVGSIEETVTVSGETPVVDLQSTTRERTMSQEIVNALPTGRMYNTLGVLVPGVTSNQRDVGGALGDTMASLTVHGSQAGDQRITQNGLNVMTLVTAGGNIGVMVPNTNAAQEVAIDTSGASAERQTGGVSINFIPRDGGNTIRGSLFATGAYEGQQSNNFTQSVKDQGLTAPNNYKLNWDINPGVGGPILKDKLWYYYTYRNNGAQNYQAGMFYNQNEFLPSFPYVPSSWTYVPADGTNGASRRRALVTHGYWWDSQVRLTWQANPKNKFAGTWDQQYRCTCPTVNTPGALLVISPEAGLDTRSPVQRLLHAEWWSPLTSRLLLEFVALHRTERFIPGELRPTDQNGSLTVTPQQYANYPSMIGVTQVIGNSQVPNNISFHGPSGTFSNGQTPNYTYRFAMSYVTGAHAYKVGIQDSFGYRAMSIYGPTYDPQGRPVRYRISNSGVNNTTPTFDQVTVFNTPYAQKNDQNHDLGLYAQDRWTMNRLTLNYGVRYDWYNSSVPAQDMPASTLGRPAASYAAIEDTVNWKDLTPRFGMAYDLQGDGKTAVKVSLNKYVAGQALGGLPANANAIQRLTNSASRTWADGNGNGVADCTLTSAGSNGECIGAGSTLAPVNAYQIAGGCAAGTAALTCTVPSSDLTDWNVRQGFGKRSYNWEFSVGVQREIMPRVSVDVSYFRRWFGNFTATDNTAVNLTGSAFCTVALGCPAQYAGNDFRYFDIVAPVDSRLPGGGGNSILQFADFTSLNGARAIPVNQVVFPDDIGAKQVDHWNGVDVSVNARLQNGLLLQGGTSTGRRYTNNCEVTALLPEMLGNDPQSVCSQTEPWRTQFKAVAAYTLPKYAGLPATVATALQSVQVSATFQSIPGDAMQASYSMSASAADPRGNELANPALSSLGVLPACLGSPAGLCNGTSKNVNLLYPNAVYDVSQNQLDMRVGRILRFGRTRTTVNFDLFNVFNDDTVIARNNNFTKSSSFNATTGIGINNSTNTVWVPTSILQARFFKISATFDF